MQDESAVGGTGEIVGVFVIVGGKVAVGVLDGVYVYCRVGVIVGVLDGVKVRVGVKVFVGVGDGVKVNVGVNGGVTTIDTLKITVRELVAEMISGAKGTILGTIGAYPSFTVTTILCLLSLKVAEVKLVSVAAPPVQYGVTVVLGPASYWIVISELSNVLM